MRLALISYFDLGLSYGIGDKDFQQHKLRPPPDPLQVGIRNPLGEGIGCDLRDGLIEKWRDAAHSMVNEKEMDLGWVPELGILEADFRDELGRLIAKHPVAKCELTIFAVGTVLLYLEFKKGIALEYLHGVYKCFEFAAYSEKISAALKEAASQQLKAMGVKDNPLANITNRSEDDERSGNAGEALSPNLAQDGRGYKIGKLLTSFTRLILCIDEVDESAGSDILVAMQLSEDHRVDFELHGKLYFGWATCALVARNLRATVETPDLQIARMLECIKIAHSFLGTCEAFEKLMWINISGQLGGYIQEKEGILDHRKLNRLRTFALAGTSLTDYNPVAAADEDQKYFALFEEHARLAQRRKSILDRCDVLYSVEAAETQADENEQDKRLNHILAVLTAITLLSVLADSYGFLSGNEEFLPTLGRIGLLLATIIGIYYLYRRLRSYQTRARDARVRK